MSERYSKVFQSILESTVWGEPYPTRLLWVAMIAMANARGNVYGAIPGLARRANITRAECEAAINSFLSPDPDSRTRDHEGRRIERIDGGFHLINHQKYAAIRSEAERAAYKQEWDRQNRPSGQARKPDTSDSDPTRSDSFDGSPTGSDAPDASPNDPTPATPVALALSPKRESEQLSPKRYPIQEGWRPRPKTLASARKKRPDLNIDLEVEKFVNHSLAEARERADWDAAFLKWILDARAEPASSSSAKPASNGVRSNPSPNVPREQNAIIRWQRTRNWLDEQLRAGLFTKEQHAEEVHKHELNRPA